MHAFRPWRGLAAAALFYAGLAQAVTFNGGAAPSGCTYDAPTKTYTCSSLPSTWNEVITIASTYRVNVNGTIAPTWNQVIQMSGSAILSSTGNMDLTSINPANLQVTGGTMISGANFQLDAANSLSANINAATATIGGGGNAVVNGNIVTSGALTINSNATVNGNVSGTVITTSSPATIHGNVNASTSFQLASNSSVQGNITAPNVTINPGNTTVQGTITATGTVSVGSNATITGNISTGNLAVSPGNTTINGNVSATGSVNLGSNSDVNGDVTAGGSVVLSPGNTTINGSVTAPSVQMGSGAVITEPVTCQTSNSGQTCGCVQGSTDVQCAPPPASNPHHIQITHPGSGLTCQPTTVTITACANAACTAPHFTNGVNVTLNPGGQVFAIGNTGVNSAATVQRTTAGSVSLTATSTATNAATCVRNSDGSANCGFSFVDSGFLVTTPNHKAGATSSIAIQAIRKDTNTAACTPAFASTRNVTFTCAYDNPASGTLAPAVAGASLGSVCGGAGVTLAVPFSSSGAAALPLTYADVGKVKMTATYTGSAASNDAGLSMSGFSYFIAAPDRVLVTQIASSLTTVATPTAVPTARFVGAGEPFTVKVASLNTAGNVTPNFGNQTPPESIALTNVAYAAGYPAGGAAPVIARVLAPNAETFAAGVSTSTMTVSDVGIVAFNASLSSGNFMNSGVAAPTASATNYVGRITPSYFVTEIVPTGTLQCPVFPAITGCATPVRMVYSKQPFSVKVTAMKADGVTTASNYRGTYARAVALTAWSTSGPATQNPPASPAGSTLGGSGVPAASFPDGTGTGQTLYTFGGLSTPTAIAVRAIDTDGVSSLRVSGTVEGSVMVVNGRLLPANNYGSELLPLPIDMQAQYWTGLRWNLSVTDNVTSLFPAMFTLNPCTGKLKVVAGTACNVALVAFAASPAYVTLQNGMARLRLQAPGAGNTGSAELFLKSGSGGLDYLVPPGGAPKARAVFGVYRSPLIYQREVF